MPLAQQRYEKPHENQNKLIYFKNNVYLCTRYY